jgi:hypothetical protein
MAACKRTGQDGPSPRSRLRGGGAQWAGAGRRRASPRTDRVPQPALSQWRVQGESGLPGVEPDVAVVKAKLFTGLDIAKSHHLPSLRHRSVVEHDVRRG